nr:ubiquitin family domain containing protein [Babesia bovis]
MNQQDIETIVLAKDCLDVCCDAISGLDSDEGIGGSQASKELRSQCEDGIKLLCRNNDIYLDDPKSFKDLLPWNLLHTLEMDLGVKEYHNVNQQDMNDFMQRYRDAQIRVHDLLRELETISKPSEPVDMDKVSRITSICALQTAIHGQMALITTILGNKISYARDSSLDTSARPGFTKAKPHERASGPTVSSNVRQGLNTASILPSTTQSSSLLASLGIVNSPQAPTISIPAYSSDDILVDSTWLRKQLTQYRNSTGFKSRMNDLVRDTKKLSNIYCTGILPK